MTCIRPILGLIIITTTLLQFSPTSTTPTAESDDNDDPPFHHCEDTAYSYTAGSTFEENLNNILFTQLQPNTTFRAYANFTNGTGVDRVNALYFCRGDIDVDSCQECIQNAVQEIVHKCKFKKQGIVWYEVCTLRYANYTIFSLDEMSPYQLYYNRTSLVSELYLGPHRQLFSDTMNDLLNEAGHDNGTSSGFFDVKEANLSSSLKLRGLAQCSPFISSSFCESCLRAAYKRMDLWSNTLVFFPSCYIRFDLYGQPRLPSPSSPRDSDRNKHIILVAVLLPVIAILLLVGGFWFWKRRRSSDIIVKNKTSESETNNATKATVEVETNNVDEARLQLTRFTYSEVKDMTNEFNRKLGEGGFGIVYYGRLTDNHKEVAVKVLAKNDAPKQFSNEAKVADFGFSKIFPPDYVSKLETRVIGTTGYVDPHFGVVLLELITGKTAIIKGTNSNLVQWVTPLFERGDIGSILDPRLRIEVGENYMTIWRATELAKKCVDLDEKHRPTMSDIVMELRECLAREIAEVDGSSTSGTTSMEMMAAANPTGSMSPQPR
ncbi:Cysteine-rich receptor-like protein kinase 25 [Bienertia sinuspersici]